jgi:hypothetical protein
MWTVGLIVGRVILFFSFTIGGCAADLPGTLPETVTDYTNAVVEPVRAYALFMSSSACRSKRDPRQRILGRGEEDFSVTCPVLLAEARDLTLKTETKVRTG